MVVVSSGSSSVTAADSQRGRVTSNTDDEIRLVISDNFVGGFIEDGELTFYIEPLWYHDKNNAQNAFVVYDGHDAISTNANAQCGVIDTNKPSENVVQHSSSAEQVLHGAIQNIKIVTVLYISCSP